MRPKLPSFENLSARFSKIEESRIYSNFGPQLRELEQRFALRYNVDASQVLVMANATLALEGLVRQSNQESWRVPSWTFAATALAVSNAGRNFSFEDVEKESQVMKISSGTRQMSLATLPFGSDIPKNWERFGMPPIIDAAASAGNIESLRDINVGSSLVISLHATKYLGCGEGAVVISGSSALISDLRSWSNFGLDEDRDFIRQGTNAKMSEFQAAVCHAVLDDEQNRREDYLRIRRLASEVADALGIQSGVAHGLSPYWIVSFKNQSVRDSLERTLAGQGIETRKWWANGCHRMPAFRRVPKGGLLRNTDHLARTTLGFPFHTDMTEKDFGTIHDAVAQSRLL